MFQISKTVKNLKSNFCNLNKIFSISSKSQTICIIYKMSHPLKIRSHLIYDNKMQKKIENSRNTPARKCCKLKIHYICNQHFYMRKHHEQKKVIYKPHQQPITPSYFYDHCILVALTLFSKYSAVSQNLTVTIIVTMYYHAIRQILFR